MASAPAEGVSLTATLVAVRSTSTGTWSATPSPDPSGITYDPLNRRLVISDSEVDEMSIYRGTNVYFSTVSGEAAGPGWTTVPWSNEPTGIAYATASRTFVSDDDKDRIFTVETGPDGFPARASTPQSFSVRPLEGDPEDVTMDMDGTADGHLLVVDGVAKKVYDYGPGGNNRFDGVPGAGGDDTVVALDVGQYGALDPEGIEYYPGRNTILVLDGGSRTVYELRRDGSLLNTIGIAAASPRRVAGITLAPASNGSGAQNLYIVDRGVDNDSNPNENDGRFYEMSVNLPPFGQEPANTAPRVSAGPDLSVTLPSSASLAGQVTDDGRPAGSTLTATWSLQSGPGAVTFANANAAATTASFSAAGTYVLRLTGSDGQLTSTDDVTVTVADAPATNTAPTVSAGPDLTVTLPSSASLAGSVTDDGRPAGSTLTATWSLQSGPGAVTFANATAAATTASFSAAGTYVLRLTGSDGQLTSTDDVTVTVANAPATNTAPTVSAGPDLTVTLPSSASLAGSVTDDGRPAGSTLTATWSQRRGPGTTTFANPNAASTTASFSAAGTYVLRLTGSDGQLTSVDDVTVAVSAADPVGVLNVPVRAGTDDAEERSSTTSVDSTDLELVVDGTTTQTVGLRFTGVSVPRDATITSAYVQFQVDEATGAAGSLSVGGQASDDPPGFTTVSKDISSRPRTAAAVSWTPPAWPTAGARTVDQRTPDLAPVLQQIVSRPGWASGNALVLVVTGSGTRIAEAYEGGATRAAVLHVEYAL